MLSTFTLDMSKTINSIRAASTWIKTRFMKESTKMESKRGMANFQTLFISTSATLKMISTTATDNLSLDRISM